MKTIKIVLTMIAVTLMVGCAGHTKVLPGKMLMEDGSYRSVHLSMATVGDTLDRSSSGIQVSIETGLQDENGDPVLQQIGFETQTGATVGGQVIVGTVPTVFGTVIQGEYQIKAAKEANKACRNGNCGGGSGVVQILNEVSSNSDSRTASETNVDLGCAECAKFD